MLSALSVLSQIVLGGPKRTFATSSGNSIKDTCHGLRVKALIFKQLKLSERADVSLQIMDSNMEAFRRTEIGEEVVSACQPTTFMKTVFGCISD